MKDTDHKFKELARQNNITKNEETYMLRQSLDDCLSEYEKAARAKLPWGSTSYIEGRISGLLSAICFTCSKEEFREFQERYKRIKGEH